MLGAILCGHVAMMLLLLPIRTYYAACWGTHITTNGACRLSNASTLVYLRMTSTGMRCGWKNLVVSSINIVNTDQGRSGWYILCWVDHRTAAIFGYKELLYWVWYHSWSGFQQQLCACTCSSNCKIRLSVWQRCQRILLWQTLETDHIAKIPYLHTWQQLTTVQELHRMKSEL